MQDTFASGDMDALARLLSVIHEFLASEVKKRMEGVDTKKDVSLLIGNTKELQDSEYVKHEVKGGSDVDKHT